MSCKNLAAKSTVDQHCSTNNSINLNTFCDIVGPDILAKCNNYDQTKKMTSTFKELEALFNVYNLLRNESNNGNKIYVQQLVEENIITPYNKKKEHQVSPIDTCLMWPVTPERKDKRNSERVPFVISSKMWQKMYEKKQILKKNIDEEI